MLCTRILFPENTLTLSKYPPRILEAQKRPHPISFPRKKPYFPGPLNFMSPSPFQLFQTFRFLAAFNTGSESFPL